MEVHDQINHLLNSSTVFLLATLDYRGFPTVITVSRPLWRIGLLKMYFYLNENGETVRNIMRDATGSVCCYDESDHESISLKGKFSIEPVDSENDLDSNLTAYQKELNHEYPVIVVFETGTAKIHMNKQTQDVIV
ncbi:pyridoxamine 5'-phosphate oxidase family protein [Enterococcus sp. BWB1-3]|uniref:pyridoxamine 5'-phosphate oxidase family protein n=1 Tax=Enterococcus sp. BWB1-3 TaxID=2787713 RepID=UPI001924EB8A|nr:pyridoxamine 5'-phosphate oxidase family protein [Enterococcus sp. BWB1-3]MBL1227842.1 pyridoxamine 5'-phosphate oxidase family protein [Enterococcus sp. BWB1-3]